MSRVALHGHREYSVAPVVQRHGAGFEPLEDTILDNGLNQAKPKGNVHG